ncbi:MAG: DNA repair protein RecO [Gammaproteobacteria bacterium]|nr:DNA repair protein RecO [Gammaproteobacteria bacterium]
MRVELEPSYVLHSRPYRETSMIIYALTEQHGIVHMVSRGARKKGNNNLQPFTKMYLSWSGRGDLVSLTKIEHEHSRYTSNFRAQVQCFYLHELILKLIPKLSPAPELFDLYEYSLDCMINNPEDEYILRNFEIRLMAIMGHPLQLRYDYNNDEEIQKQLLYRYDPDLGPTQTTLKQAQWNVVTGKLLTDIEENNLTAESLPEAKIFLRGIIRHFLQGKPLMTRRLLKVN